MATLNIQRCATTATLCIGHEKCVKSIMEKLIKCVDDAESSDVPMWNARGWRTRDLHDHGNEVSFWNKLGKQGVNENPIQSDNYRAYCCKFELQKNTLLRIVYRRQLYYMSIEYEKKRICCNACLYGAAMDCWTNSIDRIGYFSGPQILNVSGPRSIRYIFCIPCTTNWKRYQLKDHFILYRTHCM